MCMQDFYKFVSEHAGIPNVNLRNTGGIRDALFCEVSQFWHSDALPWVFISSRYSLPELQTAFVCLLVSVCLSVNQGIANRNHST